MALPNHQELNFITTLTLFDTEFKIALLFIIVPSTPTITTVGHL